MSKRCLLKMWGLSGWLGRRRRERGAALWRRSAQERRSLTSRSRSSAAPRTRYTSEFFVLRSGEVVGQWSGNDENKLQSSPPPPKKKLNLLRNVWFRFVSH